LLVALINSIIAARLFCCSLRLRVCGMNLKIGQQIAFIQTLPFNVTRVEADKLLSKAGFFETKSQQNAIMIRQKDPVIECFVPFHTGEFVNIYSRYLVRYGIDRIEYYWTLECRNNIWVPEKFFEFSHLR